MSFRLRVLGLITLVAVSATLATAWLTLRQASQQFTESITADQAQVDQITRELRDYAYTHGTWEGVSGKVDELWQSTGQRIKLVTDESRTTVVDTDHAGGNASRATVSSPVSIDAGPTLRLTPELGDPDGATRGAIDTYRQGVRFAACLTRSAIGVRVEDDALGVPKFSALRSDSTTAPETTARCQTNSAVRDRDPAEDADAVALCRTPQAATPLLDCLRSTFRRQVDDLAPPRMLVYVGAAGEPQDRLEFPPILLAAAGVAVVALAGTALLSRRVLRPIGILTAASRRLGQGDLTGRVPVHGSDELAELARSFNRMADSLQRGEERQRRLVADVAHELRTPLANLRGYLEALKDGVITPDTELFTSLHEEAVLQQRIVDDLQELALAEAGTLAYHRGPVDLAELLETCRTAHLAVADAAGVALTVELTGPVFVHADPDRLRQVLGNLITNAVRATAAGGTVRLRAGTAGPWAGIEVADTGVGIAAESLPHVFDRFWRADSARGRRTGGSGLGLAIVRQIVTDHGGTISVRSELGVGTAFTITLPASAAPGPHSE